MEKTSSKGSSASKCDVGNWIFSKLGIFEKLFGNCLDFWEIFWGFFLEDFFGGIFLEDFFWTIFWEDFFVRNSLFTLLKSAKLFESERD